MDRPALRARMLRVAVGLQLAITIGVLVALRALGEHTRATFFLLYMPRHPFAIGAFLVLFVTILAKKPRLVVVSSTAVLIALFPLMGMRLGHAEKAHGASMRLLTYNVFYQRLDPTALTREIVASNADVIVLQASRTSFGPTLEQALPGFHVHVEDELVLATKWKLDAVEIPPAWDDVRQSWAHYSLEGPNGPFDLVNVHPISARSGLYDRQDPSIATSQRTRQIASATEAALRAKGPVLIAGDTNLPEPSVVARKYFGPFHDAFADVGFGFGYTFPAKVPWMRIDRVLGGPRVHFLDVRVMPRGASDHRAVVVDFEIVSP